MVSDARVPRLFVSAALAGGLSAPLSAPQSHYLRHVLRLKDGDPALLFNGRDGEWCGRLAAAGKRADLVQVEMQIRPQPAPYDLHYLFAPLRHERLDYVVQKAVEMGVSTIQPVITDRVQNPRLKFERMQANVIEAAEQCGILALPEIREAAPFETMMASRGKDRLLVFCDEDAPVASPLEALKAAAQAPMSLLIGPEGGFSEAERHRLLAEPDVLRLSLGPRVLRADTAAVAALALIQVARGDWR